MKSKIFSKRDTTIVKGCAVIFMLVHHLFGNIERCEAYQVCNFFLPFSVTQRAAEAGKICVAIFVFLTGYGTARSMERYGARGKRECTLYTVTKYLKLEFNFLCVYVTVLISSFLMGRDVWTLYQTTDIMSGGGRIAFAVIDALGLYKLFRTPTLNVTWWYMTLAFLYVIITPVLVKLYDRYGVSVCAVWLLLPYALSMQEVSVLRYMGELGLGIWCARENILEKIKEKKIFKNKIGTDLAKLLCYGLAAKIGVFLFLDLELRIIGETVLSAAIICFIYQFLSDLRLIGKLLEFLGQHSMNIFLIHTVIYAYYFTGYIYSLRYALLILLVTLGISCAVSVVIEWVKRRFLRVEWLLNV